MARTRSSTSSRTGRITRNTSRWYAALEAQALTVTPSRSRHTPEDQRGDAALACTPPDSGDASGAPAAARQYAMRTSHQPGVRTLICKA